MQHDRPHDDFGGLLRDRPHLDRRAALRWMGGIGMAGLFAACASDDSSPPGGSGSDTADPPDPMTASSAGTTASSSAGTTASSSADLSGAEIPQETAGPYPADGSNGPNVLDESGIVRSDLTTSIGGMSGTAEGIPATIRLTVVDAATGDALPGAAVYLWHCTAAGQYSIYEVADQNYLRGVQSADDAGRIEFASVFPGCYRGRWPHCHFEVYDGVDAATSGNAAVATSQLALPQADCEQVYTDGRYGDSAGNLASLSLSTDNVFSDGWDQQLATVAGSNDDGYTVSLLIRV